MLHAKLTSEPDAVRRFMTRGQDHGPGPSVGLVEVFDFGQLPDGAAYMVMEYLRASRCAPAWQAREALRSASAADHPPDRRRAGRGARARASSTAISSPRTSSMVPDRETPRRARQGARLRHRQGRCRAPTATCADHDRRGPRHADVHVARAVPRHRQRRRQSRRLFARRDAVSDARGAAAVCRPRARAS